MEANPPWKCDQCGHPINSVEDGWVEWLNGSIAEQWEGALRGLRLVHHKPASPNADQGGCYHDEAYWFAAKRYTVSDLPLTSFVGPDGLVTLLAFLADRRFADPDEVLELIKRLHVPNYEGARNSFEAAIAEGVFEPRSTPGYYDQRELLAVLNWINNEQ
ncbi:hypothetical protein [Stenotrophomonas chelatiphaga]|uniref:hypothetical protein n=1 Tax=Stenotrophomonas chelatiphaga TaxID=517011 RepID=UPI001FDF9FB4|nr:hypothetical protein [Stenotrophomonas chelatiphaga]